MLLGVASWLEHKLGWDATIIRIAFVIAMIFYGVGLGLYLILWVVKMLDRA